MVATIKDVAKLAECSIKTVSRVVNNEPYVTDKTRDKVLDAIETLGYAPNISARRLVQRKSYMICILLHEAGFYQSVVLSKIMEIGYEHDYDILTQTYFPIPFQVQKQADAVNHRAPHRRAGHHPTL